MDSPFLEMRRGEEEREVVILIMGNSRKLRWKFRRKIEIARCGFFFDDFHTILRKRENLRTSGGKDTATMIYGAPVLNPLM